jgi:hypothetical protein
MTDGDPAQRIQLELETSSDAIHGTLEHGDGTRECFWGWLELMAALDRVTDAARSSQESE